MTRTTWVVTAGAVLVAAAAATSLCLALSACSSQPENSQKTADQTAVPAAAPAAAPEATPAPPRYDLKGTVVSVDKAGKRLTVDHGDIPGFMSAMTMPYDVKDAASLETLSPGDEIVAKVSAAGGYHLEEIVVSAKATAK